MEIELKNSAPLQIRVKNVDNILEKSDFFKSNPSYFIV